MSTKSVTVLTPCFNEADNIEPLFDAISKEFEGQNEIHYTHLFIDNASTDGTQTILRELAKKHKNIRVIINNRNFGPIRSMMHALIETSDDAVIHMVSDLQDPPELIPQFIKKWSQGNKVVIGIKEKNHDSYLISFIRTFYYKLINKLSEAELIQHFTGFGLFDKEVIDKIRKLDDPYPYFRGLIAEMGYETAKIEYVQPPRKRVKSKHTFYSLYDIAILGITSHSKVPLRIATFTGFIISILSFLVGLIYFIYKLLFWDLFEVGVAPVLIGIFFLSSVQIFFIGLIGEYIGSIHTQVLRRPLVVEKERINF